MGKYFGTDGFRGEAGITLTADHAYKVGRFLGWYYNALRERNGNNEPARIVIGKDTRRSSYMFEYSLVAGLTASGADAYLLHVTTTPSVAYIARVDDFDCGIMISASHNPYYDNGIKLIDCYGEKMPEEILLLVEDYIDGKLHVFDKDWPELPFAHREHIGCTVDYVSGRNRYMGYLISLGIYSFKGVKVGLDCANGSSWNIAKSVFDALGADTYVINAQPNGLNINNNAGSTHIEGLQKFVVEKGLDIGFAYDGDADRCLCVDEKGNVITGDHILYIYGCYMKERGKLLTNTVVTTVMSNFGLYKAFDEKGIGYAKTAVGDKYVYEYMAKNGCRIGGEQSGHIIFSKYASTGDGILTSLKMMEVMLAKKVPMSKLAEPLKIYPQVLENVRVTDKKAAQNDPAVQEAVKAVAEALGDTGRILVRESGTEPVVRVMVEAPDHTAARFSEETVKGMRLVNTASKGENSTATSTALATICREAGDKAVVLMLADYYLATNPKKTEYTGWYYQADFEYLADPAIKQVIVQGANSDDLLLRLLMAGIDKDNIYLAETEQEAADMVELDGIDGVFCAYDIFNGEQADAFRTRVAERLRG